ncbi:MAG TPA: helix-turn-helix domain-containing protein [Actinomycetales bacterium]|nr:helix-turn-helix domain-containing protein [Actinomycetales bacterium]
MAEVAELATAASGSDARTGLRAARALRRLADTLEALQVDNARRAGWSWQEIARALEISKQAVHKRYAHRSPTTGSLEA